MSSVTKAFFSLALHNDSGISSKGSTIRVYERKYSSSFHPVNGDSAIARYRNPIVSFVASDNSASLNRAGSHINIVGRYSFTLPDEVVEGKLRNLIHD